MGAAFSLTITNVCNPEKIPTYSEASTIPIETLYID